MVNGGSLTPQKPKSAKSTSHLYAPQLSCEQGMDSFVSDPLEFSIQGNGYSRSFALAPSRMLISSTESGMEAIRGSHARTTTAKRSHWKAATSRRKSWCQLHKIVEEAGAEARAKAAEIDLMACFLRRDLEYALKVARD